MHNFVFTFASWNVCVLGQTLKCADVLSEILALKPTAVFLQETKLDRLDIFKTRSFLPRILDNIQCKPSIGTAGGMINAFSSNHFTLISQSG